MVWSKGYENPHNFPCERAVNLEMTEQTLILHEASASYAYPVIIFVTCETSPDCISFSHHVVIVFAVAHLHKSLLNSNQNENDAEVHFVCETFVSFHISATAEIVKVSQLHQEELLSKGRRHVTLMSDTLNIDIHKILVGKLYGNRPLERPGRTMERKR